MTDIRKDERERDWGGCVRNGESVSESGEGVTEILGRIRERVGCV